MASRIRELRNSLELTRKELAEKTNVTDKTIQNYENKGIFKSTPQLTRIARFFKVEVSFLLSTKMSEDKQVSAYDKNGNILGITQLAIIVEENFEDLKKVKRIRSLIDIEALKVLLKAKKGDKFDIDEIG